MVWRGWRSQGVCNVEQRGCVGAVLQFLWRCVSLHVPSWPATCPGWRMQPLPDVQLSERCSDQSRPYGAEVSNAWICHTHYNLPAVHVVCATAHTGTISTVIFFWNVRSFRLVYIHLNISNGSASSIFKIDILPPSRKTGIITVFIWLFLRDTHFPGPFWFVT
jgi:hypothetical protein